MKKKLCIFLVVPLLSGTFLLNCNNTPAAPGDQKKHGSSTVDIPVVPGDPADPGPTDDPPVVPDDPTDPGPTDDPPVVPGDLTEPGPFTKCTYADNSLDSDGYSSAIVYYPCEKESGPFASTTLTSGFMSTKDNMYWLADQVVTYGFIIIDMTPNIIYYPGTEEWSNAHKAGVEKLLAENNRTASPIFGLVDTDKLSIMGYSMGGGGTLMASNELGSQIKTAIALAPWEDTYTADMYDNIQAATVCITGTEDTLALSSNVKIMYEHLPASVPHAYIDFNGAGHFDWTLSYTAYHGKFATLVIAWMKAYLDDEAAYLTFFNGDRYQEEAGNDWFNEFIFAE